MLHDPLEENILLKKEMNSFIIQVYMTLSP